MENKMTVKFEKFGINNTFDGAEDYLLFEDLASDVEGISSDSSGDDGLMMKIKMPFQTIYCLLDVQCILKINTKSRMCLVTVLYTDKCKN